MDVENPKDLREKYAIWLHGRRYVPAGVLMENSLTDGAPPDLLSEERFSPKARKLFLYGSILKTTIYMTILAGVILVSGFLVCREMEASGSVWSYLPAVAIFGAALLIAGMRIAWNVHWYRRIIRSSTTLATVLEVFSKQKFTCDSLCNNGGLIQGVRYRFQLPDGTWQEGVDWTTRLFLPRGGVGEQVLFDPEKPKKSVLLGTLLARGFRQDDETGQLVPDPDFREVSPLCSHPDHTANERLRVLQTGPESVYVHGLRYEPVGERMEKTPEAKPETALEEWPEPPRRTRFTTAFAMCCLSGLPGSILWSWTLAPYTAIILCFQHLNAGERIVISIYFALGLVPILLCIFRGVKTLRLVRHGRLARARLVSVEFSCLKDNQARALFYTRHEYLASDGSRQTITGPAQTWKKIRSGDGNVDEYVFYDENHPKRAVAWSTLTLRFRLDTDSDTVIGGTGIALTLGGILCLMLGFLIFGICKP